MRSIALTTTILFVALQTWSAGVSAAGLSLEPGGLLLQDVPVGETRSVVESSGISFVLHNRDAMCHEYRISAHRPSATGNGNWAEGYSEIPDPSWIVPVPDVLVIPPGSSASFDVTVDVPGDGRFYNQRWAVTLAVESVPTPGTNVALALYPALQIETKAQDKAEVRPLGTVAVAPATLRSSAGEPTSFLIYNNDSKGHAYHIHVGPPAGKIPPSPGLTPVDAAGLIVPSSDRLWLEPGETGLVQLNINPEANPARTGLWEQLVFVRTETGDFNFVRFQMVSE